MIVSMFEYCSACGARGACERLCGLGPARAAAAQPSSGGGGLHVAIDGAHKHDGVVEVRLDLLPLEAVHLGRSGDSQPQYEDGAHSKLCGRDKRRHWYVVDDELVDEKQRA